MQDTVPPTCTENLFEVRRFEYRDDEVYVAYFAEPGSNGYHALKDGDCYDHGKMSIKGDTVFEGNDCSGSVTGAISGGKFEVTGTHTADITVPQCVGGNTGAACVDDTTGNIIMDATSRRLADDDCVVVEADKVWAKEKAFYFNENCTGPSVAVTETKAPYKLAKDAVATLDFPEEIVSCSTEPTYGVVCLDDGKAKTKYSLSCGKLRFDEIDECVRYGDVAGIGSVRLEIDNSVMAGAVAAVAAALVASRF